MPELVSIPLSLFELVAEYLDPDIETAFMDRKKVVKALFDALRPWKITFNDIEVITQGKLPEQGVKFTLPQKRVSVFFGPASLRFTKDNATWIELEETAGILSAVLSAVSTAANFAMASYKAIMSLHVQPRTAHFMDILRPFLPPQLVRLENDETQTMASVAVWKNRKITLDGSGAIANALFLRLERDFPGNTTISEMAQQLRDDESAMFDTLGIKEDR